MSIGYVRADVIGRAVFAGREGGAEGVFGHCTFNRERICKVFCGSYEEAALFHQLFGALGNFGGDGERLRAVYLGR